MPYRYSDTDRNNINWMRNNSSRATLRKISLRFGSLMGLTKFALDLNYPVTAVAGENGSGKSTLLAIAACAYHNSSSGYKPVGRKNSYYTFRDFFIQSRDESPPQGIFIAYEFLHNNWKNAEPGPGNQARIKRFGGKWNNYAKRVRRNVIYFGIQRVVPHYERSAHKSYSGRFAIDSLEAKHRDEICEIAGRIIGRSYDTIEMHTHSKYSLPVATSGGIRYSGFNMGAGESAVFDILSSLFEAGEGTLLVIDEIELGLHEQAQVRFMEELKQLCKKLHCQVICSTHSHVVLDSLPPEGRVFIESVGGKTRIVTGISPDYACGMLRGRSVSELDVLVEDTMAEMILRLGLPHDLRQRISIIPIGSVNALLRLVASRYLEERDNFLCVFDGDQRSLCEKNKARAAQYAERYRESKEEMSAWIDERMDHLPSNESPEKWLIQSCKAVADKSYLLDMWNLDERDIVDDALEAALLVSDHDGPHNVGRDIRLPEEQVKADLIRFLKHSNTVILDELVLRIQDRLDGNI